jgi:hypothetical protein
MKSKVKPTSETSYCKRDSVAIELSSGIREVFGSNLCPGSGYPEGFYGFPQSVQVNPRTGQARFLPNSLYFVNNH